MCDLDPLSKNSVSVRFSYFNVHGVIGPSNIKLHHAFFSFFTASDTAYLHVSSKGKI